MSIILRITNAGRAALVNAQRDGTNAVRVASVGISPTALVASSTATTLPGEVKRIATISGGASAADVIHVTVRDESADTYTVRSFALYLADGTLFALYGQTAPIIEKSTGALLLLAIDATLVDVSAAQITFGNTNFMNPAATTETPGVVELATEAEAVALADALRALTPKGLAAVFTAANVLARLVQVDGAGSGLDADLLDGLHASAFAQLAGAAFTGAVSADGLISARGNLASYAPFEPRWYGAASQLVAGEPSRNAAFRTTLGYYLSGQQWRGVLNAIANGVGAPLDIQPSGGLTVIGGPTDVAGALTQAGNQVYHTGNDGAGSGLDADLLDGRDGAWFADIAARLGFTPLDAAVYTAANILAKLLAVDGAGSGLDADLLDGLHAGAFAQLAGAAFTGAVSADGLITAKGNIASYAPADPRSFGAASQLVAGEPSRNAAFRTTLGYYLSGQQWRGVLNTIANGTGAPLDIQPSGGLTAIGGPTDVAGALTQGGSQVYHTSNDGAGSGLDADLLDGLHAGAFAQLSGAAFTGAVSADGLISAKGNLASYAPADPRSFGAASQLVAGEPSRNAAFRTTLGYYLSGQQWRGVLNTIANGTGAPLDIQPSGGLTAFGGPTDVAGALTQGGSQVYHTSNDGSGSGLDADLLDGWHRDDIRRWGNLLNVPGSFPPSAHSHGATDLAPAFASRLFASDGYQVLPGGLILQWCTGSLVSSGVESVQNLTFPITFPNGCLQAIPGTQLDMATTAGDAFYQLAGAPTASGVAVQRQYTGGGRDERPSAPRVIAIGF